MSTQELEEVLTLLEKVRGEGTNDKPLWQQRSEMDVSGLSFPMPEETIEITQARLNGIPGLLFKPQNAVEDKYLLYMHGGGYLLGSPSSHRHLVARLATDSGICAVSIDYRLAPEWAYPAAIDDAVQAYRGLLEHGIDAKNIIVGGDSAGGGLTACLLIALKQERLPQPAGAILLSPWTDLTNSGQSHQTKASVDPLVKTSDLEQMAESYLQGADKRNATVSPLFADLKHLAPIYVQVGDAEILLSDSVVFSQRAKESGVDVKLDVYPNMIHIFPYFWPMLSEARQACSQLANFCKEKLELGS